LCQLALIYRWKNIDFKPKSPLVQTNHQIYAPTITHITITFKNDEDII